MQISSIANIGHVNVLLQKIGTMTHIQKCFRRKICEKILSRCFFSKQNFFKTVEKMVKLFFFDLNSKM